MSTQRTALAALTILVLLPAAHAGDLTVVSTEPPLNATNVGPDAVVRIHFDQPVHRGTVPPNASSVHVGGMYTGPASGTFVLENGGQTLSFTPDQDFVAGEKVGVVIANSVRAADGTPIRSAGFSFGFRIASGTALRQYARVQTLDLRDVPQTSVRIYGGAPCDLDNDGWIDIAVVNEDSSDVRVLRSRADSTPLFHDFMTPVNATGTQPSPNEPADFDGDGEVDLCTANVAGNSMSVLLGNGDGTFQTRTDYAAGTTPKGIAVLDMDGDGDMDIAVANLSSSDMCKYENLGNGTFGAPVFFEGGAAGEHGLCAADMDEDGIMDLVVGALSSQVVLVLRGNGDGTFTQVSSTAAGGRTWMLVCGDVNGDGHVDVSTANGSSGSASMLLGDGAGNLSAPAVFPTGGFTTATDLGDLDGDGDLDWMVSDFGTGTWYLLENDGAGGFALDQTFQADNNCACAAMVDTDRDGDLDLILFDEIADKVFIEESTGLPAGVGATLCFGDGSGTPCPCGNDSAAAGAGCAHSGAVGMTIAGSGTTSISADDLVVTTLWCPVGNTGIYYAGTVSLAPGAPLYDGLQCAGGDVRRFRGLFQTSGLVNDTGFVAQDPSGIYFVPGGTYYIQYWSRDVAAGLSPCGLQATFSPALAVVMTP